MTRMLDHGLDAEVLTTVLESGPPGEHVDRQLLLNSVGLATVAYKMAACEDDDLCQAGLRLSIALLDGGNKEVQSSFLTLLQDSDARRTRSTGPLGAVFVRPSAERAPSGAVNR